MKSKNWNPPLEVGDKIVLYHMEGETTVIPGTKGVVIRISKDPFEDDSDLITVNWENGSTLSLITSTDAWKKIEENIQEQDEITNFLFKNQDILDNFDWRFLRSFLYKIRESGIVNMFESAPLLFSGKEHIERYYGEGREDEEEFQEVLELADKSKNKMIQGSLKYLESKKKDIYDIDQINSIIRRFSQKIVTLYVALSFHDQE